MPDGMNYQTPEATKNLVGVLSEQIKAARAHWRTEAFKAMKNDMDLAFYGDKKNWTKSGRYVVNLCQAHVKSRTASLYAKNPKAIAKPRARKMYRYWDGRRASLIQAFQQAAVGEATGVGAPIEATLVLQDFMEGTQKKKLIRNVGETLEIVYAYFCDTSDPDYKTQMKSCVRRAITNGVAYVKLGYQREMSMSPFLENRVKDLTDKLASIERQIEELGEGEIDVYSAEAAELKLEIENLQNNPDTILREGLVFDFPLSTSIIPDMRCRELRGFIGADWIAHEILMTQDQFRETYGFFPQDSDFTPYNEKGQRHVGSGAAWGKNTPKDQTLVCVWEMYHKKNGLVYTLWDGGKEFAEQPAAPQVTLDRFWPIFALTFNALEHEEKLFPPSDITLIRTQQREMNESRQALRQHRVAARPKYAAPRGALDEDEKKIIGSMPAHAVVEVSTLTAGQRISDLVQPWPTVGVDPNLYQTAYVFEDTTLQVGSSESSFGSISGGTATESAIAEDARLTSVSDAVDELNDFLSEIAQNSGQILLQDMSSETVAEIAGPGAVWPQFDQEMIVKELFLDIEAGSSGRPNRAAEIANMERILPFLLQVPGVSNEWLARRLIRSIDEGIDMEEAIAADAASMVAMNNGQQVGTGNPQTDPAAQGPEGRRRARPSGSGSAGSRETFPAALPGQ